MSASSSYRRSGTVTDANLAAISRALLMLLGDAELPLTASIDAVRVGAVMVVDGRHCPRTVD
jgi:putative ATP-dependent endonuclease of OLD family